MAKRMVTRTVTITTGTAVAINVNDLTPTTMSFQLPGEFKTPEHIMKSLKPLVHDFKVIAVRDIEKKEVRYGMPEEEFISMAKELPPLPERTKEPGTEKE